MNAKRFLHDEAKKDRDEIMENEGKTFYRERIAPMYEAAEAKPAKSRNVVFRKRFAWAVSSAAVIILACTLCFTLLLGNRESGYGEIVAETRRSTIEELNQIIESTTFKFHSDAINTYSLIFDSETAENLLFAIKSSETTTTVIQNVNINILVSNRYNYEALSHVSDEIIESAYLGWPLKYSVLRLESDPLFTFKVHAELDTGAEKIYIDYEQTSLGDECEFLNYIAQTITPKEAA